MRYFGVTCEDEIRTLLTIYAQLLSSSLPQKAREYVSRILEAADESLLMEWIDVVFKVKSDIELLGLLKDVEFYKRILEHEKKHAKLDLSPFLKQLRIIFRSHFVESSNLKGILGIYQTLLYCEAAKLRSEVYEKAVKMLWEKLSIESCNLHLQTDAEAPTAPEHDRLLEMVKVFENQDYPIIKDLIKVCPFLEF